MKFECRRLLVVLLLLAVLPVFLFGCPAVQGSKPISQMTPKEKVTWMMGVYNSQYKDYQIQAAQAEKLTPEAKDLLKKKKGALEKVYPLIKMYDGYVQTGALPDTEVEASIISLLNSLLIQ